MFVFWIISSFIATIIGVIYSIHLVSKKSTPRSLCDTCIYLNQKGGVWAYECGRPREHPLLSPEHFDKAPTYCKWYKSRQKEE